MKRQTKILLITIGSSMALLVGVLGLAMAFSSKSQPTKQEVKIYTVKTQPASIFQGRVLSIQENDYTLDPGLGTLAAISVQNGQSVKVGDVLLTYNAKATDMTSLEYAVKTAQLTLSNSQKTLASAQARGAQLQEQYNQAIAAQKEAQANLTSTSAISADPQSIQDQMDANNQTIQQDGQTISTNQLALQEAQANLSQAQSSQTVTVKAVQDGIAIVGNVNDSTNPLITVLNRDTQIKGQISEFDYNKIKLGDKVTVKTLNTEQEVSGVITYISPVPEISSANAGTSSTGAGSPSIAYYNFTIHPDENLQYGYGVQISVPDTDLFIPISAVKKGRVELKESDGKFRSVKVDTKPSNSQLLVLSGLKAGDKISKNGTVHD